MAKGKKRSGGAKKAMKKQREAAAAAAAAANGAANGVATANGAAANGEAKPKPIDRAKQRAMVKLLMQQADKQGLQVGDKRFVIPAKWWERWCQYVDYDEENASAGDALTNPPPNRINNSPLLHVTSETKLDELMGGPLRPQLKESYHYVLLPQEVWDSFVCWYGGGPTIARFVVQAGDPNLGNAFNRVQVYPEQSETDDSSQEEEEAPQAKANGVASGPPSRKEIAAMAAKAASQRRASPVSSSLSIPKVCGACKKTSTTLKRCGGCQMIWYCGAPCQTSHWKYHKSVCRSTLPGDEKEATILEELDGERRGKMGMRNLGNTCFMSSALQCLSHTEVITRYFLSNEYLKDINKDNPLGTGGNLATEYDNLLKELWFGTTPSTSPGTFKRAVGRFAPQFSGFQQHDSQELLAYILDGLHEDLNRIKHKPYTEVKESDGSTDDAIVAKEAWDRHLLRNDSIFVDHVQGQFKSTVVCPVCAKKSITFDPFNCIQLELPMQQTRRMEAIFVPLQGVMTRYAVDVSKKGSVLDLKVALGKLCGVPSSRMLAADIYQSMTYRVIGDAERLVRLRDEDRILVYEVEKPPQTEEVTPPNQFGFLYHRIGSTLVGDPLMFTFNSKTTCAALVEKWRVNLSTHVAQSLENEIPTAALARSLFLADRDGAFVRNEPIPNDGTLFLEYVRANSDDLGDGQVFVSVAWTPELLDVPASPRPDFERIVSHETVRQKGGRAGQGGITLDDCFRNFTKPETLDQANLWYCSKCKEHRQARKTMEIWKLPDVLILSLKRFEYRNEILRDKLDAFVDFPLTDLDMSPYCLEKADDGHLEYDLYAVSNHYGSMGFGHYTAFAKSWQDGNGEKFPGWYSFDDSHVSPVMAQQVKTNAAYILFYKRKRMGGGADAAPMTNGKL